MHENKIDTSNELKKSKLLYLALLSENEALRVSLKREQAEVLDLKLYINTLEESISMMSVPYQRYMKLVALMPKSLKNIIKKIVLLRK